MRGLINQMFFVGKVNNNDQDGTRKIRVNPKRVIVEGTAIQIKVAKKPIAQKQPQQNVDIDKRVDDIITNIVKNYFLTNSERAINDPTNINKPTPPIPMSMPPQSPIQEQIITMKDLTTNYQKIETPVELIETISGKAKTAKLVYEGKEVKKWLLGNKEYCFPTDPMSIRMCYTK